MDVRFILIRTLALGMLTSCTHQPDLLKLAEAHATYREPISEDDYAYIVHGFYVDRGIQVTEEGRIKYRVLYDNREIHESLKKEFGTSAEMDKYFASFVEHKGETDCQGNNSYTLTRYDLHMQSTKVEKKSGVTEPSAALCLLLNLTNKEREK